MSPRRRTIFSAMIISSLRSDSLSSLRRHELSDIEIPTFLPIHPPHQTDENAASEEDFTNKLCLFARIAYLCKLNYETPPIHTDTPRPDGDTHHRRNDVCQLATNTATCVGVGSHRARELYRHTGSHRRHTLATPRRHHHRQLAHR